MKYRYYISSTDEHGFNELASGKRSGDTSVEWRGSKAHLLSPSSATFHIVWREPVGEEFVQPLAVVCAPEEHRRLFGRLAQIRTDMSPLTSWCHLLTPDQFASIDEPTLQFDLDGWEASWSGLVVAEALLLSERPIARIRLQACLATRTFAIARTLGLWGDCGLQDVSRRFDAAQLLLRQREVGSTTLTSEFSSIWNSLIAVSTRADARNNADAAIVECLRRLRRLRAQKSDNEVLAFVEPLKGIIPEVSELIELADLTPEQRLKQFDEMLRVLEVLPDADVTRRTALAMLAGYLATVAAGGSPSLSLAETVAARRPAIVAWAYVLGGVAEHVTWTSAFDGLGRLIARELTRPLHLDEPPEGDFAIEEAQVLIDPSLSDPFVHLKIKQARALSVSILPGVNIAVAFAEASNEGRRATPDLRKSTERIRQSDFDEHLVVSLADALWPHLSARVRDLIRSPAKTGESTRSRGRKKMSDTPKDQNKLWSRD